MTTEPISDERLAEIRAGDFVRSLITAAEYDCYDKFEGRFISPPEKHPASEAARIILGLLSRLDKAEAGAGWLFHNPDTGTELSDSHPVESGECTDAQYVRPALAPELAEMLIEAWGQCDRQAAENERLANNRDMWKGQCERQAAELTLTRIPPPPSES